MVMVVLMVHHCLCCSFWPFENMTPASEEYDILRLRNMLKSGLAALRRSSPRITRHRKEKRLGTFEAKGKPSE